MADFKVNKTRVVKRNRKLTPSTVGTVVDKLPHGAINIGVLWPRKERPAYYSPDELEIVVELPASTSPDARSADGTS